jgi:predicted alpha/beta-hydrolase family hydrolase
MKYILLIFWMVLLVIHVSGQSNYTEAIQQGDEAFNKQQLKATRFQLHYQRDKPSVPKVRRLDDSKWQQQIYQNQHKIT